MAMRLKLPDGIPDIEENMEEEDNGEGIVVTVHPEDKPPIVIKKRNLIRWSKDLERELRNGQLSLSDGFAGNWKEVMGCITLLNGDEVEVTFDNIKVGILYSIFTLGLADL